MPAAIPTDVPAGSQTPTLALKFALSHLMRKQAIKTADFCGKRRIVSAFLRNSTSTSSCSKRTRSRFAPSRTAKLLSGTNRPAVDRVCRYVRIRLRLQLVFLGELSKSPGRSQPRVRTGVLGQLGGSHIGKFCPRRCDFPGKGTPRYPSRHHTSSRIAATICLSSSGGARKGGEVEGRFARREAQGGAPQDKESR